MTCGIDLELNTDFVNSSMNKEIPTFFSFTFFFTKVRHDLADAGGVHFYFSKTWEA